MEKLRVGILGASRGMDFAMRMLLDYDYAEITAVCETYPVLRKKCEDFSANREERSSAATILTSCWIPALTS